MGELAQFPQVDSPAGLIGVIRALASGLTSRAWLATKAGLSFGGKRDLYTTLGYPEQITLDQYWAMFERNGIAERVVSAMAEATWRGGGEVIENDETQDLTPFEQAFADLNKRLKLWSVFQRGDIVSGVGQYAVVVLGLPGRPEDPVERVTADQLLYATVRSQLVADIQAWEEDIANPRYGQPKLYLLKRLSANTRKESARIVHWSRVIHLADGLLEDSVFGTPRLRKTYNWCQDLEKVAGGGAEAFWLRANQGLQLDLDKDVKIQPGSTEETDLKTEVDEYVHNIRRVLRTRGVRATVLGSDTADFSRPVSSLISLISGSAKIPQRILLGSERGELASTQDRFNWDNRVRDRRLEYAGPFIVRQFVDRCIALGILPPVKEYDVRWPEIKNLDDVQRADVALKYAQVNESNGSVVITEDEIRDRVLELPPLTPEQKAAAEAAKPKPVAPQPSANPQQDPSAQGA
jgi:hypothetical protein